MSSNLCDKQFLKKKVFLCGIIAILLFIGLRACTFVIEPDYFWHVELGNWMLQNKQVMKHDIYSWVSSVQPLPEFAHSWAGSVIIAIFHNVFYLEQTPYMGAYIYEITFYAIFLVVLFFALKSEIPHLGNDIMGSTIIVFVPVMLSVYLVPRPQMIGYILFVLMLIVFSRWDKGKSKIIVYLLPVISLIWVNVHGGTAPMLLGFCAAYLISGLISLRAGQITSSKKNKEALIHLSIATGLSATALLINPYGFKIYTYAFLFNNAACKEGIAEWQPATIYSGMGIFLIAVFAVVLLFSDNKFRLSSLIPVVSMAALTLLYVRGTPYLGIALSFFLATNLRPNYSIEDNVTAGNKFDWFIGVLAVVSIAAAVATNKQLMAETATSEYIISQEMVLSIKENKYERLYNDYNIGGYLIYSNIPVFIDSRADLYPSDILTDGKNLQFWNCDADKVIAKYSFDGFLINNNSQIFKYFDKNPMYSVVCSSETHTLFEQD